MNKTEFRQWFKKHRAAFPALDAWLGGLRSRGGAEALSEAEVLTGWSEVLADVRLDDALEATRRLQRGDESPPPSFDDHPRFVRGVARRVASQTGGTEAYTGWRKNMRMVDREWVFECPTCEDTGMVRVWHRKAVEAMAAGKFKEPGTYYSAVCRCACKAGDRIQFQDPVSKRWYQPETFNEHRHCKAMGTEAENVRDLEAFAMSAEKRCGAVPFEDQF